MNRTLRCFFVLSLTLLAFAAPLLAQDETGEPLEIGAEIEGEFTAQIQSVGHPFAGEAGQLITITMVSPDFDTYLVLLGPDGDQVAFDDDSGPGSLNSRIGPISLPDDGEYTIVADSYAHRNRTVSTPILGVYTLSIADVTGRRIEYTQDVRGAIEDATVPVYYLFRGQEGDVVAISAASDDLDASLILSTSEGTFLMSSDSTFSLDGTARISGYALPRTGNYILAVSSLYGDETGDFDLRLDRIDVVDIEYGDTANLSLNESNGVGYFRFEGEAGDVVTVTVRGNGEFDTTLTINGPDNYPIANADDTNNLDPAVENLILSQTGPHTILVQPYVAGDEGEVTVSLVRGELPSLDDGPRIIQFSGGRTREILTFEGQAGETVRLRLIVLKNETASPSVSVTQAEQSIGYASATTVTGLTADFRVPQTGRVFVQIDEYSYSAATIRVELSRPLGADTGGSLTGAEEEPAAEDEAATEEAD